MGERVPEAPTEFSRVEAARRGMGGVWLDDEGKTAGVTPLLRLEYD